MRKRHGCTHGKRKRKRRKVDGLRAQSRHESRQFGGHHATRGQNYQTVTTPASPGRAHTPIRPRNSPVGAVLSYPSFHYAPFCALAPNSRRLRLPTPRASTASSGRNSASSRSPALVLGCPFLSFSSTFRSRHQSLYLSSMVGYSNPEIQICKSAKIHPERP